MNHPTSRYFAAALLCIAAINGPQAEAAGPAYPTRPIRMVVPFPPGGATDLLARILAQRLGESLGQQVVVDNRPGAGGTLGSRLMLDAQPDGYTILMGTTSTHAIGPHLYAKPPYDPARDFAAITLVSSTPTVLLIGAALPPTSVKELIAYAKSKPGVLNYGSSGIGTQFHLSGELLKLLTGINIVHIPYKGTALVYPDMFSGQIALLFDTPSVALPFIKAGRVRALGVTSAQRAAVLPEVPTIVEAGVPGYNAELWFCLVGPAKLPAEIAARIAADTAKIVKLPDVKERLDQQGMEAVANSPAQLQKFIAAQNEQWSKVVRNAGVKAE
jgi:tripartite-type tricarboxylate transporter receptor subunit TctC